MPKERNKKGKRKSTSDDYEAAEASKEKKPKVTKKLKKHNIVDEIGKSKQLSAKVKTSTQKVRKNSKYPELRMNTNGKIMPSLAELEKMFEGSESDDEDVHRPAASPSPERSKTPDQSIVPDPTKVLSPKTIQEISNKVSELISTLIPDNAPPPPVVPQTPKPKKNGEPYIVGCKERDKIPDAPSQAVIGRAWDKYGVNYNFKRDESDDDECQKQQTGYKPLSKSIFNPKSEDIAAMLESSEILSDGSVDSNKTVPYEYSTLSPKLRTFSPLPSTSKDNETILINDLRFNESLIADIVSNDSSQGEVEVIELPCETIMVDDDEVDTSQVSISQPEVTELRYHPPTFDAFEDDDLYSTVVIDLDQAYDNSDCEIVDVDEVLAENKNIIDKYKKDSYTNSVTHVQLGTAKKANTVLPKQESIILDEVESNPPISSTSTRDQIESIVTDYFKQKSSTNDNVVIQSHTPQNTRIPETIDLSESFQDASMLKNMMDSFLKYSKNFLDSWTKNYPSNHISPRKRRLPMIIDTIDLDQSNLNSRNSASDSTCVGTAPNMTGDNENQSCQTSNLGNTPNDNSVIIVSNLNVNVTPQNIHKKPKKGKNKKNAPTTTQMGNSAVAAPSPSVGRTIGDCPICMDNLSNKALASTICGHIFCMTCIQAAIKSSGKRCPTCRKALRGVGYHQLFL